MNYQVRVRDYDLDVTAVVTVDTTVPDGKDLWGVDIEGVTILGDNNTTDDVLPLLSKDVVGEIETAIRRQASKMGFTMGVAQPPVRGTVAWAMGELRKIDPDCWVYKADSVKILESVTHRYVPDGENGEARGPDEGYVELAFGVSP